MNVKCKNCKAKDVTPADPRLFELRGKNPGPIFKCLTCGAGVEVMLPSRRCRTIHPERWEQMQRSWERKMSNLAKARAADSDLRFATTASALRLVLGSSSPTEEEKAITSLAAELLAAACHPNPARSPEIDYPRAAQGRDDGREVVRATLRGHGPETMGDLFHEVFAKPGDVVLKEFLVRNNLADISHESWSDVELARFNAKTTRSSERVDSERYESGHQPALEGSESEGMTQEAAPVPEAEQLPRLFCWKCGVESRPDGLFCVRCGESLSMDKATDRHLPSPGNQAVSPGSASPPPSSSIPDVPTRAAARAPSRRSATAGLHSDTGLPHFAQDPDFEVDEPFFRRHPVATAVGVVTALLTLLGPAISGTEPLDAVIGAPINGAFWAAVSVGIGKLRSRFSQG